MTRYPVTIQEMDPDTETWSDYMLLHVLSVNRTGGGENYGAGAEQYHQQLTFTLRWSRKLEAAALAPQTHRLLYRGRTFNLVDYDDPFDQHRRVKLVGAAYEP